MRPESLVCNHQIINPEKTKPITITLQKAKNFNFSLISTLFITKW
jgi:hypothetical protein